MRAFAHDIARIQAARAARLAGIRKARPVLLTLVCCGCLSACGSSSPSPSSPSQTNSQPAAANYEGKWKSAGPLLPQFSATAAFTVSEMRKVTAITLAYSFAGCSVSETFSNLNLDILDRSQPPIPPPAGPEFGGPSFTFQSDRPDGTISTFVFGTFQSSTKAAGFAFFLNHPGCGENVYGGWTAEKR